MWVSFLLQATPSWTAELPRSDEPAIPPTAQAPPPSVPRSWRWTLDDPRSSGKPQQPPLAKGVHGAGRFDARIERMNRSQALRDTGRRPSIAAQHTSVRSTRRAQG